MAYDRKRITDKLVKSLPPSENKKGYDFVRDDQIIGFGIRNTKAGHKSFVLNYNIHGRERRITIGDYPTWSVVAARERAAELKRGVDSGVDPLAIKLEERKSLTMRDLWREFEKRHLPSLVERSRKDTTSMFVSYILPKLGGIRVKDITGAQIDDLHRYISGAAGKTRANRVLEALRSCINKGIKWGFCEKNPADGFKRNPEEGKENYLTPNQLSIVFDKLEEMPNKKAADIIRMLILTGARLGEVLNSEKNHFDLDKALWIKPSSHTKQKRRHPVPLSPEAVEVVKRNLHNNKTKYIFPSDATRKPMPDIKKPWIWLQKEAGIQGFRIHDLRHTYASFLISSGENLAVIGKLLGHTQHQTTMRYAHLMDDPLRKATGKVGHMISNKKGYNDDKI